MVLTDGRQVVVKARPCEPRLLECAAVQRSLAVDGFPCPTPLAGPGLVDTLAVSAETLVDAGAQRDVAAGAEAFATLLARLVAAAPAADAVPSLAPSPLWNGWDHDGAELWPDLDHERRNLNRVDGPAWVDTAAARVRRLLRDYGAPPCVGHGEKEAAVGGGPQLDRLSDEIAQRRERAGLDA